MYVFYGENYMQVSQLVYDKLYRFLEESYIHLFAMHCNLKQS